MVVGYFVGISFGVKGVAIAYMVLTFSLTFPGILYGGRPIGIRFREIYSTIWKYILASVLAGAILFHLKSLAILENMIVLKTILSLVFYLCVYLALVVLFYRGIAPIREIVSLFKIMVGKRHQEEIN
jgi:PST family polysaccharide transporter